MTVKELKYVLNNVPDDSVIYISEKRKLVDVGLISINHDIFMPECDFENAISINEIIFYASVK